MIKIVLLFCMVICFSVIGYCDDRDPCEDIDGECYTLDRWNVQGDKEKNFECGSRQYIQYIEKISGFWSLEWSQIELPSHLSKLHKLLSQKQMKTSDLFHLSNEAFKELFEEMKENEKNRVPANF